MGKQGFTKIQKKRIERMASEGKPFSDIVYAITKSYDRYWEVYEHCWRSGCLSWVGTKRMITNRLKKLQKKRLSEDERKNLIEEIRGYVNYLYYQGKMLHEKVKRVRRAIF